MFIGRQLCLLEVSECLAGHTHTGRKVCKWGLVHGWGGCGGTGGNHAPAWEKWCQISCFSWTVEKYWDLFQHPALGTVYLSSFMHVTPSDTNWTLQAPLVPSCIYDDCSAHMEAWEGCPAQLLGWLCAVIETFSAYLCPCISDVPRVRAAMPWQFKRPSKSSW